VVCPALCVREVVSLGEDPSYTHTIVIEAPLVLPPKSRVQPSSD
jgi:hypothetical protein